MEALRPQHCSGLPLGELPAGAAGIRLVPPDARAQVTGVTLDSRKVAPGDLYAALPGAAVHGARFIAEAMTAGAVAVLTDPAGAAMAAEPHPPFLLADDPRAVLGDVAAALYGHPSRDLTMLGVTGTNGKTTVAHILEAALDRLGQVTGLIGTIETKVAGRRVKSVRTTPEAPDLHALFALMREQSVRACVMEVSSHALFLHRVDGVVFDVAAFTNLSRDHLDFHGTMEEYYLAKAGLFVPERARRGVVVVDDAWGARLAGDARIPVVTLATGPQRAADWYLRPDDDPAAVTLSRDGDQARLRMRAALPGRHNRTNTAVAALMLLATGASPSEVEDALSRPVVVPGRMEAVDLGAGAPTAYVDFAHTPEAISATLTALREVTPARMVAVVGAGGGRDPGKRGDMGAAAARLADVVVVTDDNPRQEDPAGIRAAVRSGAESVPGATVLEEADRGAAITLALAEAGADGAVAVLGKGHETGQETGAGVHDFDDRVAIRDGWRRLVPTGARTEAGR